MRVIIAYSHEFIQLSTVAGWIYTVAWAFSFWPQIIGNFQRKSVVGLNFDFVALSTVGQTLYFFFNVGVYFSNYIEVKCERRIQEMFFDFESFLFFSRFRMNT